MTRVILSAVAALALVVLVSATSAEAKPPHLPFYEGKATIRRYLDHDIQIGFAKGYTMRDCRRRSPNRISCNIKEFEIKTPDPSVVGHVISWFRYGLSAIRPRDGHICLKASFLEGPGLGCPGETKRAPRNIPFPT